MPKNDKKKEKWFRCPKCFTVRGPMDERAETVFCKRCRMTMQRITEKQAKQSVLID